MKSKFKVRPTLERSSEKRRRPVRSMLLALVAFVLSLGALVRVSALPAEARIQETWFAYSQDFRMNFSARVSPGSIYSSDRVGPDDLVRVKVPGEPPIYRRVLISQLTDSVRLEMPYTFKTDRPAQIKATYRVDGTLTAPNLWQRPYPFVAEKEATVTGTELTISDMTVEIPVKELTSQIQALIEKLRLSHDQVEVKIRPVVQITVDGQQQPIQAGVSPEFTVLLRNPATVEVDEPKTVTDSKSFTATKVLDRSVTVLGMTLRVSLIRQISLIALTLVAVALGIMVVLQWLQRRSKAAGDLQRLGSSLIAASHFSVPADAAVVDVPDVPQLIAVHLRTDRPVVQVGNTCYLVDGNTCYRLVLKQNESA